MTEISSIRLRDVVITCCVFIVACVAFGYRLGEQSLWLDEVYHRWIGLQSVDQIMNQGDLRWQQLSHGYYLLIKWSHYFFDEPSLASRLPAFVCGVFAVLFLFLLAREWFGSAAGCVAVLLVCTAPTIVRWTQDARFYSHSAMGVLACSYLLNKFLKKPGIVSAMLLCTGISVFLRLHSFAFVFIAILLCTTVLYLVCSIPVASSREERAVILRTLMLLTGCVACSALLWMPFPLRLISYYSSHGSSGSSPDGWWTEPFSLAASNVWLFVQQSFLRDAIGFRYTLVTCMCLLLSLVFRKPRVVMFVCAYWLSTVALVFAMNQSKAVVMPKRFLFLGYVYALLIAGGGALIGRALFRATRFCVAKCTTAVLRSHPGVALRYADRAGCVAGALMVTLWTMVFVQMYLIPPISSGAYEIAQYYYEERAPYKVFASLLSDTYREGERVAWDPPSNDAWLLSAYLREDTKIPRQYLDQPISGLSLSRAAILDILQSCSGLWLGNIEPAQYGFMPEQYVRVPYAGRTLNLMRGELTTNVAVCAAMQEDMLLAAINESSFPCVDTVEALAGFYSQRGRMMRRDQVVGNLSRHRVSRRAVDFCVQFYQSVDRPFLALDVLRSHADLFWWNGELQLRVARMAHDARQYEIAARYATRYLWFLSSAYDQRAEIAGNAFLALRDYANAEKWLKRACARVRAATKGSNADEARLRSLEALLEHAVVNGRVFERLNEQLRTFRDRPLSAIQPVFRALDTLVTNPASWYVFSEQARRRARSTPVFALFATLVETSKVTHTDVEAFSRSVRAETWPLYVYAMQRLIPERYQSEGLVPWYELQRRGFPPFHKMNDAAILWFAQFYEKHVPYPAITGFYWAASAQAPNRQWWSAISSAEAAYRSGCLHDCKVIIAAHENSINRSLYGQWRLSALKKRLFSDSQHSVPSRIEGE